MGRSAQAELRPWAAMLVPWAPIPPQASGQPKSNKAQPKANLPSHELFLVPQLCLGNIKVFWHSLSAPGVRLVSFTIIFYFYPTFLSSVGKLDYLCASISQSIPTNYPCETNFFLRVRSTKEEPS